MGFAVKVFLEPANSAYFLERFSLGPPYEEFQKMADFGVFAKLAITRTCLHVLEPQFAAECCPMIAL